MAETLLLAGVKSLYDLLDHEYERFQGVEEKFEELKKELDKLRGFLKDADAKQHTDETVRKTVKEIQEIVYDAEDVIETFIRKEELRKTSGIIKRIGGFAHIITDRRKISFDIEALTKRISTVIRNMVMLGVQHIIGNDVYAKSQERQREMRKTFSNDNESDIVGWEEKVNKLVGYLVDADSSQVVSIIGMGGIGKTTLARKVFNNERVKKKFKGLAWVCISQQFTRKCVWQTILQKLSPKYQVLEMTDDQVQEKLVEVLETQENLIVLDDIWKETDWDIITKMFPRNKGWKVLLTSRNEGVAIRPDTPCLTYEPDCLTVDESWILFGKIVFPESKIGEEMEKMGRLMIKHCGGLPLAVKVLGGLLAEQYTLREWTRLYENIKSHIIGGTSIEGSVYNILYLSFEELPTYLKQCFLYLSHYPEDSVIDVGKLAYYWAAERIPRPRYYDVATIEEVADRYVEELVKRNMVISERDKLTSRFKTCHLHDMMREVCLLKAKEDNFVQILETRSVTSTANSQSSCKSRRLVVHVSDRSFDMEREIKNPKLRSLMFVGKFSMPNCLTSGFTKHKLMRVLDLSEAKFEGGKVPSSIGKLIHLRYLNLFNSSVSHLPPSLWNLKLLLYLNLDILLTSPINVSNKFNTMRELRYLSLPTRIQEKSKVELGNLTNLETLKNFSTKHSSVTDLQGMTRLRDLSITINGGGCTIEILSSLMSEHRQMENLTITDHTCGEFALESILLQSFPSQLTTISSFPSQLTTISSFPSQLTTISSFPSQLTTISLSSCGLVEDPMPILEKMLHLNVVNLSDDAFAGKRMVCSSRGFPQLRNLNLERLHLLEEWIIEEGSMPILFSLVLNHCSRLKELPQGLISITSLKTMVIYLPTKYVGVEFRQGGKDYYKVQHIPSYKIIYDLSFTDEGGMDIYDDEADYWRTFHACYHPPWMRED